MEDEGHEHPEPTAVEHHVHIYHHFPDGPVPLELALEVAVQDLPPFAVELDGKVTVALEEPTPTPPRATHIGLVPEPPAHHN